MCSSQQGNFAHIFKTFSAKKEELCTLHHLRVKTIVRLLGI
jgi:hypothetical protein